MRDWSIFPLSVHYRYEHHWICHFNYHSLYHPILLYPHPTQPTPTNPNSPSPFIDQPIACAAASSWTHWNGNCYKEKPYPSGLFDPSKAWQEARDDCILWGADLVIINSKEENDFVRGFGYTPLISIWLGCSDEVTEGTWECVDGVGQYDAATKSGTGYWGELCTLCERVICFLKSCHILTAYLLNYSTDTRPGPPGEHRPFPRLLRHCFERGHWFYKANIFCFFDFLKCWRLFHIFSFSEMLTPISHGDSKYMVMKLQNVEIFAKFVKFWTCRLLTAAAL